MKTYEEQLNEAAWELCEYDHDRDKKSFKAGAAWQKQREEKLIECLKFLINNNMRDAESNALYILTVLKSHEENGD